jgi:hypothetical protein
MKNPCLAVVFLALESSHVIWLRTAKLSRGGCAASDEVWWMIGEKMIAAIESGAIIAFGGSYWSVLELYRHRIAANAARLVE